MCGDYLLITGITFKQIKVQLQFSSMNLTISLNSSFIIDATAFLFELGMAMWMHINKIG